MRLCSLFPITSAPFRSLVLEGSISVWPRTSKNLSITWGIKKWPPQNTESSGVKTTCMVPGEKTLYQLINYHIIKLFSDDWTYNTDPGVRSTLAQGSWNARWSSPTSNFSHTLRSWWVGVRSQKVFFPARQEIKFPSPRSTWATDPDLASDISSHWSTTLVPGWTEASALFFVLMERSSNCQRLRLPPNSSGLGKLFRLLYYLTTPSNWPLCALSFDSGNIWRFDPELCRRFPTWCLPPCFHRSTTVPLPSSFQ